MCKLDCCCRFLIAIVSIPFMLLGLAILIVVGLVKSSADTVQPLIQGFFDSLPIEELKGMKLDINQAMNAMMELTQSVMDILLFVGIAVFVVSLIGVIAGCGRRPIVLYVHAAITLAVGFILLVICIYYASERATVLNEVSAFLKKIIDEKYQGDLSFDVVSIATTGLNIFFKCCGANNGSDFSTATAWKYRTLNISQFVTDLPAFDEVPANKDQYDKYKDPNTGKLNASLYTPTDGSLPVSQRWLSAIENGTITLDYPLSCCKIDVDSGKVDQSCLLQQPSSNNSHISSGCVANMFAELDKNETILTLVLALAPGLPLLLGVLAIAAACVISASGD